MTRDDGGPHLLAADVGGTKTAIALARPGPRPRIVAQSTFPSQSYARLEDVVAEFLQSSRRALPGASIGAACFAVAGPVSGNAAMLTNLGWHVAGAAIEREFGVPRVRFLNDFAAAGRGIEHLDEQDIETLQPGQPDARGTRLIIGAGTGLGMGLATWAGERYVVHPSEGGHADFAPVNEEQDRLLEHLRRELGRVSYERILSGAGLVRVFAFLRDSGAGAPTSEFVRAEEANEDPASLVTEFAQSGKDPLAAHALEIFVSAYGSFAGNMALVVLARGGVYLAGGIAPKILSALKAGPFLRAFNDKGRFAGLASTFPVRVVMNPEVGLYGALIEANSLCR